MSANVKAVTSAHCPTTSTDLDSILYFFKVIFGGHMSFLRATGNPCLGFLVTSPLCFKARVDFALFTFFAEANVIYIPQDPPLVLHMCQPLGSQHCSWSLPHMHVSRGGTWLRFERAITWTEDKRATIVPGTRLNLYFLFTRPR